MNHLPTLHGAVSGKVFDSSTKRFRCTLSAIPVPLTDQSLFRQSRNQTRAGPIDRESDKTSAPLLQEKRRRRDHESRGHSSRCLVLARLRKRHKRKKKITRSPSASSCVTCVADRPYSYLLLLFERAAGRKLGFCSVRAFERFLFCLLFRPASVCVTSDASRLLILCSKNFPFCFLLARVNVSGR